MHRHTSYTIKIQRTTSFFGLCLLLMIYSYWFLKAYYNLLTDITFFVLFKLPFDHYLLIYFLLIKSVKSIEKLCKTYFTSFIVVDLLSCVSTRHQNIHFQSLTFVCGEKRLFEMSHGICFLLILSSSNLFSFRIVR